MNSVYYGQLFVTISAIKSRGLSFDFASLISINVVKTRVEKEFYAVKNYGRSAKLPTPYSTRLSILYFFVELITHDNYSRLTNI